LRDQLDFEVSIREERGKNAARRLRTRGAVPGVLYGLGRDAVAVTVDSKKMTTLLKSPSGHNQILNLKVGAEQSPAMAVDWQADPVRGTLLHVDLQRIDLEKKVHARVPVVPLGVAVGVKEQAGLVEVVSREIEIDCLPLEVPSAIEIDISELSIGDAIRVSDLPEAEAYSYLSRPERVIVHVIAPKVEKEEEAEEEEVVEGAEDPAAEGEAAEQPKEEAKSES
jgi:large subunit ribosomal protein L25